MQPLVLLLGWIVAAVTMVLGYNVVPLLAVLAAALAIVLLRAWDRRRR